MAKAWRHFAARRTWLGTSHGYYPRPSGCHFRPPNPLRWMTWNVSTTDGTYPPQSLLSPIVQSTPRLSSDHPLLPRVVEAGRVFPSCHHPHDTASSPPSRSSWRTVWWNHPQSSHSSTLLRIRCQGETHGPTRMMEFQHEFQPGICVPSSYLTRCLQTHMWSPTSPPACNNNNKNNQKNKHSRSCQ